MMNKKTNRTFWILEALLLAAAAFFEFAVIGYITLSLVLISLAAVLAIYKLLAIYSQKNERLAKMLKIILTSLICLGIAFFLVVEVLVISSAHTDKNPEAPYLIVLGAGVNGTEPSLSLLDRLEAAKAYLDEYPDSFAIVSGCQGSGEAITEAECMRRWLVDNGISDDRIIKEEKAESTYQNIKYSLELISEYGGDPSGRVAIASSEYHLYRAKSYAGALGALPIGVAAHTSLPILMINYFIREAFGVAAMWFMG